MFWARAKGPKNLFLQIAPYAQAFKVAGVYSRATNRKLLNPVTSAKMAISQLLLSVACSNLVGRKSKFYFIIKFGLLLSMRLCWREIRPDAGKTSKNEFVASFLCKWLPREADSDKALVLLMNRYVCLVTVSLTNILF